MQIVCISTLCRFLFLYINAIVLSLMLLILTSIVEAEVENLFILQ